MPAVMENAKKLSRCPSAGAARRRNAKASGQARTRYTYNTTVFVRARTESAVRGDRSQCVESRAQAGGSGAAAAGSGGGSSKKDDITTPPAREPRLPRSALNRCGTASMAQLHLATG